MWSTATTKLIIARSSLKKKHTPQQKQNQYVPVDTVICARASMPLVIAVIEYMFLGRELPSLRSWLALSGKCFFFLSFFVDA